MTIEEKTEEVSFIASPFTIGGKVIYYKTAIRIAKEYAEEMRRSGYKEALIDCKDCPLLKEKGL